MCKLSLLHPDVHYIPMYTTSDVHSIPIYTTSLCTLYPYVHFILIYTKSRCTLHPGVHYIPMYTTSRCTLHLMYATSLCTLHPHEHYIPMYTASRSSLPIKHSLKIIFLSFQIPYEESSPSDAADAHFSSLIVRQINGQISVLWRPKGNAIKRFWRGWAISIK